MKALRMTKNNRTDWFGLRDWKNWPFDYSPLHLGEDYSAKGPSLWKITAPCDGRAYALLSDSRYIGGMIMIIPEGEKELAIYCFHTLPFVVSSYDDFGVIKETDVGILPGRGEVDKWVDIKRGRTIGHVDFEGIHHPFTPHLDIRIACTPEKWAEIRSTSSYEMDLGDDIQETYYINAHAERFGVDKIKAGKAVVKRLNDWNVSMWQEHAIHRMEMNPEQMSQHSNVGKKLPVVWINPDLFFEGDFLK